MHILNYTKKKMNIKHSYVTKPVVGCSHWKYGIRVDRLNLPQNHCSVLNHHNFHTLNYAHVIKLVILHWLLKQPLSAIYNKRIKSWIWKILRKFYNHVWIKFEIQILTMHVHSCFWNLQRREHMYDTIPELYVGFLWNINHIKTG